MCYNNAVLSADNTRLAVLLIIDEKIIYIDAKK